MALGAPLAGAVGVAAGPIAADDLRGRPLSQPRGELLGRAVVQDIDRAMTFDVDQDGAIAVPASERELVHAQHAGWTGCGIRQPAHQPQEAVAAATQAQAAAEPLTGSGADVQPNPCQRLTQGRGAARVRHDQGHQLLGEGLARAAWGKPAEAANRKVEKDRHASEGQVGDLAGVVTMDVVGSAVTLRTGGVAATAARQEVDHAILAGGLTQL